METVAASGARGTPPARLRSTALARIGRACDVNSCRANDASLFFCEKLHAKIVFCVNFTV
ncbi:hypothetical protein CHELA1G11_20313 [Hyphomicrobiales bacterium]|nr:hypothetical protein CHELA1G11_20313 [Hyphomicrobiales bacterium]CAH1689597.1 hypothetical protein CHELA1G2_20628 [Hyphomicrobiales bacterium]